MSDCNTVKNINTYSCFENLGAILAPGTWLLGAFLDKLRAKWPVALANF